MRRDAGPDDLMVAEANAYRVLRRRVDGLVQRSQRVSRGSATYVLAADLAAATADLPQVL